MQKIIDIFDYQNPYVRGLSTPILKTLPVHPRAGAPESNSQSLYSAIGAIPLFRYSAKF